MGPDAGSVKLKDPRGISRMELTSLPSCWQPPGQEPQSYCTDVRSLTRKWLCPCISAWARRPLAYKTVIINCAVGSHRVCVFSCGEHWKANTLLRTTSPVLFREGLVPPVENQLPKVFTPSPEYWPEVVAIFWEQWSACVPEKQMGNPLCKLPRVCLTGCCRLSGMIPLCFVLPFLPRLRGGSWDFAVLCKKTFQIFF